MALECSDPLQGGASPLKSEAHSCDEPTDNMQIDLEDGEIVDSDAPAEDDHSESVSHKKSKKKKKKKRKLAEAGHNKSGDEGALNKKRKRYHDHDQVTNEQADDGEFTAIKKKHRHHSGKSHGSHLSPSKFGPERRQRRLINRDQDMNFFEENEMMGENGNFEDDGNGGGGIMRRDRGARGAKRKRMGKRQQQQPIVEKKSVCKFFMDGKCFKGDDCSFSHDVVVEKKRELCKFYLMGVCRCGDDCGYMHEQFPCKFFHTGAKCYSDENCRFSHDPLTDETRMLLSTVLKSGRVPGFNKSEEPAGKRPSLLGTPPANAKRNNDYEEGYDFDGNEQPDQPMRPNYYLNAAENETSNDYGNSTPVHSDGHENSWDGNEQNDVQVKQEIVTPPHPPPGQSASEDQSDAKLKAPEDIPSHLPKRQRELFLRIQQQQREAEIQAQQDEAENEKDAAAEKMENWYSDDDDDEEEEEEEGDQPLTAVLKKLQQQPSSEDEAKQPTTASSVIASMLNSIRNLPINENTPPQPTTPDRQLPRDPRLSGQNSPPITKLRPRADNEYYLVPADISKPGDYNKYVIISQSQQKLQNDPRIKKIIEKYGNIQLIIQEEERKVQPKLPDFIPPTSLHHDSDMRVKPNYAKGVDPRTGRRPALLPPPPPAGTAVPPAEPFNFPPMLPPQPRWNVDPQVMQQPTRPVFNQNVPPRPVFNQNVPPNRMNFLARQRVPFRASAPSRDPRTNRSDEPAKAMPEIRDPRMQPQQQQMVNESACGPTVPNRDVKNMFSAIDPTASPFC